jgi:hypothetical protein
MKSGTDAAMLKTWHVEMLRQEQSEMQVVINDAVKKAVRQNTSSAVTPLEIQPWWTPERKTVALKTSGALVVLGAGVKGTVLLFSSGAWIVPAVGGVLWFLISAMRGADTDQDDNVSGHRTTYNTYNTYNNCTFNHPPK